MLFALILFTSCKYEKGFIISEVKVSDSPADNIQLGRDLISYDYKTPLTNMLKIDNDDILKHINIGYFTQSGDSTVTIRLTLSGSAIKKQTELIQFFEDTIKSKIAEYEANIVKVANATRLSATFLASLDNRSIDSVWNYCADEIKAVGKEKFSGIIDQRSADLKTVGQRTLMHRRIQHKLLDGRVGTFYDIAYQYAEGQLEDVTLEEKDNQLEVLGYNYNAPAGK